MFHGDTGHQNFLEVALDFVLRFLIFIGLTSGLSGADISGFHALVITHSKVPTP